METTNKKTDAITLNGPADWPVWYKTLKGRAITYDIWDQMDPTIILPNVRMVKPKAPLPSDLTRSGSTTEPASTLIDLTKTDREIYAQMRQDYNNDIRAYDRESTAIREIQNWITSTRTPERDWCTTSHASH
ncbi:gag protein [Colletotrichum plurivorum]|uniref:Gag protein n=1 Tax=Colletotrichum plurivorum TaxID=2175906 RepID=A0A8H6K5A8_9PEZI|nr:gag protein [Colletotrichum plurivorum]